MKNLKKLFLLYFVYEFEDGHEDVKLLGTFSSKEKAKKALLNIKKIPELSKFKNNFVIDEDRVNFLGWTEGFITVE